jgi:hypothetical protein
MLTRVGGLLLIIGSLLAAFLAVLVLRGAPVGLGGAEVNGQYVLAAFALIAAGTAAVAFGGAAPFGTRTIRVATVVTSAGLLLIAASGVGGETTGVVFAIAGLFITAIGFLALGAALVRSPGASRWIGAGMLAGAVFAIVGTIGPHDIQPVALAGIALVIASIAALGILGIRAAPAAADQAPGEDQPGSTRIRANR